MLACVTLASFFFVMGQGVDTEPLRYIGKFMDVYPGGAAMRSGGFGVGPGGVHLGNSAVRTFNMPTPLTRLEVINATYG
jgi:hypothetical protein